MRLIEVTISITTRNLEYERAEFIRAIESIIQNRIQLTDDEFTRLLEISSIMMKKYPITDVGFNEVLTVFSKLVSYHKGTKP